MINIPFNKPYLSGKELAYIAQAHQHGQLAGDGLFTQRCEKWLEENTSCHRALLTHSCTASLEMAAMLANIKAGDEIIMPSYTYVSTANAFVLRGGIPVFVDIRPDTFNIDETLIEQAITPKTKAIVPVHYAGVACEMDFIMEIANRHHLIVIEDAAQGILASYKGRKLGSIGHLGCYSFHETKNISSGEGGALLINDSALVERAEIMRNKGTNRNGFLRGEVDKYTWVDVGSSYLPGEIVAAYLWSQLENADVIASRREEMWMTYHASLETLENQGYLKRPLNPFGDEGNAHMYPILLSNTVIRNQFIASMKAKGINCIFHYVPLHSSPYGLQVGRSEGDLKITTQVADCIVRLPLWLGLEDQQGEVIKSIYQFFNH